MVTLAQEIEPDQRERLHCQSTSMNHQLDSLTQQIKTLSEKLAEKLDKLEKEEKISNQRKCWTCGSPNHMRIVHTDDGRDQIDIVETYRIPLETKF